MTTWFRDHVCACMWWRGGIAKPPSAVLIEWSVIEWFITRLVVNFPLDSIGTSESQKYPKLPIHTYWPRLSMLLVACDFISILMCSCCSEGSRTEWSPLLVGNLQVLCLINLSQQCLAIALLALLSPLSSLSLSLSLSRSLPPNVPTSPHQMLSYDTEDAQQSLALHAPST